MDDNAAYEPGTLMKYEEGDFSLAFSVPNSDIESAELIFDQMGYDTNGYAWDAVVDALVRMRAPDLVSKLNYNSEGSMFCVESSDPEALKQVAQLIRDALQNVDLLKEALKNADPELF